ncbi:MULTISPECIES: hypothetical protein [unclassified Microcoleus]|uniref:hypothetical protein n=1 Tax=unclassified Microcoleus TaxID=2642155 RepID=UPI002FD348EE
MKTIKSSLIILSSVGLLFLGACGGGGKPSDDTKNTSPESPPAASKPASSAPAAAPAGAKGAKGGQVVNAGAYHLEFVPEKQATGTHLDLYLQKGDKKETVADAKVSAQVQLPNGKQQTLAFKYDPADKHYTAVFPVKGAGQYPVKVNADIKGEKVDGRFTFTQ